MFSLQFCLQEEQSRQLIEAQDSVAAEIRAKEEALEAVEQERATLRETDQAMVRAVQKAAERERDIEGLHEAYSLLQQEKESLRIAGIQKDMEHQEELNHLKAQLV